MKAHDSHQPDHAPDAETPATARRGRVEIGFIVAAVLVSGVGVTNGIAVGGILAQELAGSATAGGLAQTASILGAGAVALPLAGIAKRRGRRKALISGYGIAAVGALVVLVGTQLGVLAIMLVGMGLFGSATATNLQSRFVATEYALPQHAGRAMSIVIWGSTIGSVAGPNITSVSDLFGQSVGLHTFAGPYLFSMASFIVAVAVVSLLRAPATSGAATVGPRSSGGLNLGTTLRMVASSRSALFGLTTVVGGHMMMVSIMVMTPVSMHNHGADLQIIGFVISGHIFGMFGLSPLFGWIVDRRGSIPVCFFGMTLFLVAIGTGIWDALDAPSSHARIMIALVFLGLGWCGTLIGGSALLTKSLAGSVRVSAQGSSDALMNFGGAGLAALAGPALELGGFFAVNVMALAVIALLLAPLSVRATSAAGRAERATVAAAAD